MVEPPLPKPFLLPLNYPKVVKDGIKTGQLCGQARTKFLSAVASHIFSFKEFPTRDEYNHIAEQVIQQYPFMANDGNFVSEVIYKLSAQKSMFILEY